MTGYGRGEVTYDNSVITVEVRALNAKLGDIRIKTPLALGQRELDLRRLVQDKGQRGKFDITIDVRGTVLPAAGIPNADTLRACITAMKEIASGMTVSDDAIFQAVMRIPSVLQSDNGDMQDAQWEAILSATGKALVALETFRAAEGKSLSRDMGNRIREILRLLDTVDGEETARNTALRDRLTGKLRDLQQEGLDPDRLEQEMLYYTDKLDIREEKVRLRQHCEYFLSELQTTEPAKGKKLNFITQEIGREINTLGSKAQWSPIQHTVVAMKNALEEIKEQLANAL